MQQGDKPGRHVRERAPNPRYALSSETPSNTHNLGASGGVASQPPPYPGTQTLPSMGLTFSQRPTQHPEVGTNFSYQASSLQGPGSYNSSNLINQNYNLHLGNMNRPISPNARPVQPGIHSLSPGAVSMPRKSLAGMISPIRQQAPPPLPLNMPPPSSPVVVGGRMQSPMSPLSVYMSQSQSPQRRTTVSHMSNVSARCYPPQQSPTYCQNPVSYNYSPQTHQVAMQRSPVPNPMYVDPSQHGQMSPMIPRSPHHSPQPVAIQGPKPTQSPYKAARQLNMSASPQKSHYMPSGTGDANPSRWQYGSQSGQKAMWENVNVTQLAPLPVLSSDTLDLLSTLTVSTVSSPIRMSSSVTVAESQMPKSTLLQQQLLMPATPIRTTTTTDRLLAIVGQSHTGKKEQDSDHSNAPPSRSDSKPTARPPQSISEKVTAKPVAQICCTAATRTASIMTSTKADNPPEENMTATHSKDSFIAGELHVQGTTSTDNNMSHEIVTEQGRLDDESDAVLVPAEIIEKRIQLCEIYRTKLQQQYDLYKEYLTELFFLRNGGNFMNYVQFKKRPSTKLVDYLKSKLPDIRTARKVSHKTSNESVNSLPEPKSPASDVSSSTSSKRPPEKHARSRSMSHDDVIEPKQRKKSIEHDKRPHPSDTAEHRELRKLVQSKVMSPVARARNVDDGKTQTPLKLKRLPKQSTAAQLDESIGSQEEILERAKQEAVIQRKVVELRKQGLWTQRRLPKVLEPARSKTHWDYLLEEMRWLAGDFAQERKWKRAAARKLVRAVAAFHKEQHDQERRAKREEQNRLRRIASTMAREIRVFWGNVGKVVEYKQRSLLDEKRQKALDMHLSYIVDQTEKYSDWLTKGLNKPTGSLGSASPSHSMSGLKSGSDDDFLPQGQSTDDEETIAVAEEEFQNEQENEVSLLKKESELPFEELLSSLPDDLIENIGKPLEETVSAVATSPVKTVGEAVSAEDSSDEADAKPSSISLRRSARKRKVDVSEEQEERKKIKVEQKDDDAEFDVKDEGAMATDDESTIAKEEEDEKIDHGRELADLQAEGDMPIEELMKMYGAAFDPNQEDDDGGADKLEPDRTVSSDAEEPSSESEDEESGEDSEKEDIGMDYLFKADTTKDDNGPMIVPVDKKEGEDGAEQNVDGSPTKEITDVAAEAASLQPTGFTLATTQVVTPIPVLLKHTLREYQHIGLDWLVTMYDKRLNGILADEMGLGKTIQTIALLAHLACDKGVWGPHLIVVPTSVMLNWEMEFKKWCPGFKILTYYGSQKERKAKRTGWTKSNAFHVCITSYKLVLQDNASFRRKKWKYLVLDEAQNIKNFKSQRWQTLLNFNSQRRLLLTGTPLQNNLMELWSLMHFLMPHVFQSHKEFKEWFSKPLTGMIEGGQEYNEKLVRRLHKVLRPFLLRRIKKDVEKQMPNKYEHVVRCHLSKRQRFLYDDFMSQASTKDTLETGHFMSVINILMQLRKVCNHPNLFEPRPIVSPFYTDQMSYHAPSLVTKAFDKNPFESFNLQDYHMHLPTLANIRQTNADLLRRISTPRKLIEELDDCGTVGFARDEQPKAIGIREQLANLLKEREKSGRTVQHGAQPVASMPLLTIPITSGTGPLQLASTSATALVSSRVITLPQSKSEDSVTGKSTSSQGFTLQYQTPQGTRVAIPNKQIRQLAGGIVKIMTPTVSAKTPAPNAQSIASSPSQGAVQVKKVGKAANVTEGTVPQKKSKGKASPIAPEGKEAHELLEVRDPGSYVDRLEREFRQEHRDRCMRMADENERRCHVQPVWLASDTISFLKNIFRACDQVNPSVKNLIRSSVISELVKSEECRIKEFKPVTDRFAFVIPLVEAKPVDFYVSHPNPSSKAKTDHGNQCLQAALKVSTGRFHSIDLSTRIQFPEARLIQYDCGKLQVLDVLLRRFYTEKHKCLIFTQMTKVLDILEAFLSYHGYRYLRLDGSTRVEQRMLLMERFNNDPRIFCFILSTRSGGIGVNLTGADTVIFYDSDWNPTMDAQAQDRCHRIGQTRDVHIYRLISERTVEENILKKANQKRLLGDIAIEGGSFTTAFFKEHAIKDLFNEPTGLEDMPTATEKKDDQSQPVLSKPVTARQKAIAAAKASKQEKENNVVTPKKEPSWEDALQQTEDKEDVDAAKQLQEEQDADMEEFTENAEEDRVEGSRVHEEMKSIYEELSPIEKYALRYLEETTEEINREELELAEEQVHRSKQDWELAHLVALKEEEERRLEEEEDEIFYTREDAENQVIDGKRGAKKKKRKKEKDICFLDMPTSSSEDENEGIDVEMLDNGKQTDNGFDMSSVTVTVPKLKGPVKKTHVKNKKITTNRRRGGAQSGRGRIRSGFFGLGDSGLSPSKRRQASNLTHDITMHGYYENSEFLYYNDENEGDVDSYCGEEAPWDDEVPWSDREDWPETPSEDNMSSDDDMRNDNTVCILTEDTPEKREHKSLWGTPIHQGAGGRGQIRKVPFYNVVVETNITPKKLLSKAASPVAKPKTVESINQRVNKTINNSTQFAAIHRPLTQSVVPTISLRPRPKVPVQTVRPVFSVHSAPIIQPVRVIPASTLSTVPTRPQALNTILQQQATQRQKLQSYKIPLKTGATPARPQTPLRLATTMSSSGTLQFVTCAASTKVIQLSKLTSGGVGITQHRPNMPNVSTAIRKPARLMPTSQRQTILIQPVRTAIPVHIVPSNPSKSAVKSTTGRMGTLLHRNVPPLKRTVMSNSKKVQPTTQRNTNNKVETDRGLFDIVNSVEFLVPPPDPEPSTALSSNKGSLLDSLQQEFMAGEDMALGDDDDMITLNLEPVSPSDPQLINLNEVDDNEEERNVFESFQSLLEQ